MMYEIKLCEICANSLANKRYTDFFLGNCVKGKCACECCGYESEFEYTWVKVPEREIEMLEAM